LGSKNPFEFHFVSVVAPRGSNPLNDPEESLLRVGIIIAKNPHLYKKSGGEDWILYGAKSIPVIRRALPPFVRVIPLYYKM
jgi:hypothetical protein